MSGRLASRLFGDGRDRTLLMLGNPAKSRLGVAGPWSEQLRRCSHAGRSGRFDFGDPWGIDVAGTWGELPGRCLRAGLSGLRFGDAWGVNVKATWGSCATAWAEQCDCCGGIIPAHAYPRQLHDGVGPAEWVRLEGRWVWDDTPMAAATLGGMVRAGIQSGTRSSLCVYLTKVPLYPSPRRTSTCSLASPSSAASLMGQSASTASLSTGSTQPLSRCGRAAYRQSGGYLPSGPSHTTLCAITFGCGSGTACRHWWRHLCPSSCRRNLPLGERRLLRRFFDFGFCSNTPALKSLINLARHDAGTLLRGLRCFLMSPGLALRGRQVVSREGESEDARGEWTKTPRGNL